MQTFQIPLLSPAVRTKSGLATWLLSALILLLPSFADAQADVSTDATDARPIEKRDAPANRLLLPFYKVDTTNPSGASTLWAIRNESLVDLTVTVEYYESDSPQAPQQTSVIVLGGKEIRTGNVRDVANLEVDEDGFARGYVIFQAGGNAADLSGDYFVITSDQDYAEGSLLVDASDTVDSDLCNLFTLRFITGGGFGGSTEIIVWVESDTAPLDPGTVAYSLFDSTGQLQSTNTLFLDNVNTRFDITALSGNLTGGALEIQFAQGVRGHVALAISALGRFSVGYDATCKG